ncbi:MAG: NAD(P)-dependent oxidoreductase [Pseudomonadota bacterium]
MTVLVTGSAGHLGEALVRQLRAQKRDVRGLDRTSSPFTDYVGSISDPASVRDAMSGIEAVIHTATLHKPHVVTHSRQAFIDSNVTGTLNLLEAAYTTGVSAFVFTSTTSVFGDALRPALGEPAAWITEQIRPIPKNIYGITKLAAEDLCALFHRLYDLNAIVLRTSRFFLEADDHYEVRDAYADANAKTNEFLYRRVDIEDVVDAHLLALEKAPVLGFDRLIVSSTSPFEKDDLSDLRFDAASVVRRRCPEFEGEYARRSWSMFPTIDRVYVNACARERLGWRPRNDFRTVIDRLARDQNPLSPLAQKIGIKGYHDRSFSDGPYPIAEPPVRRT